MVADGLKRVDALKPGDGFVNFVGGVASQLGAFTRVEAGWQPKQDLSVYGYGQASSMAGFEAGAGLQWKF